jgi:hypothetical protein
MLHPNVVTIILFVAGLVWFGIIALWPNNKELSSIVETKGDRAKDPVLNAYFVRSHLMPRSALQDFVDQVLKLAGREEHKIECDFLDEVFLVNTTENEVTIKTFVGEVQTEEGWKKLKRLDDLNDYKIQTGEDFRSPKKDLVSLAKIVESVPLKRGVGYRGWLRFEFAVSNKNRQKTFHNRVTIIDALGGEHVVSVNALDGASRRGFKDPHFLAFQSLTYQIAAAAGISREMGPVTMVYAHHPEHSDGLGNTRNLWEAVRKHTPIVALFMESYQCGEQAEHPGLQAADFWAYELRHHFEVIRPDASKKPRWPFLQFVKLGLNYDFTNDFISYHDEYGLTGLGKMSRVQRLGEINLFRPGFVGLHPKDGRLLDQALRKLARANTHPAQTSPQSTQNPRRS